MHSLLGDRFIKRFAGEIRRKLKNPTSRTKGQNPDADDQAGNPNKNGPEEMHEDEASDSRETRQDLKENNSEGDNG